MKNLKSMKGARKEQGFTIIELVVVILLLGILTATALPRFMDVTDDARNAVQAATAGGLRTGVALLRASAVAAGSSSGQTPSGFEGSLAVNDDGYPLLSGAQDCDDIYTGLLQTGATTASGTASGSLCTYSLSEVSRSISLDTLTGIVTEI